MWSLITCQCFAPCVQCVWRNCLSIIAWLICPFSGLLVELAVTHSLFSEQRWPHCTSHLSAVGVAQYGTYCQNSMSPRYVSSSQSQPYRNQSTSCTPSAVHKPPLVGPTKQITKRIFRLCTRGEHGVDLTLARLVCITYLEIVNVVLDWWAVGLGAWRHGAMHGVIILGQRVNLSVIHFLLEHPCRWKDRGGQAILTVLLKGDLSEYFAILTVI